MNTLGNIIWFIFGGLFVAIEYVISSIILCLTIIGIPFAVQTFKLAKLSLFPFGKKTVLNEKADGCLSLTMNILWILIGGIWIAATHLVFGVILFITIIGIPFAKQHFKLASVALLPFGREIVKH